MNTKEVQAKVNDLLAAGTPKQDVFVQLTDQGVKDSQLAYFVASHPDPVRREANKGKIKILVVAMVFQALLAFLVGFDLGAKMAPNAGWIIGGLLALICLLFAWGFSRPNAGAYNGYLILTIVQLPGSFGGLTSSPVATLIGIAMNVAIFAYVWYVRQKLFPDFAFITPKKVKGQYVFSG